ncbi:MAG: hypothetical protein QXF12_04905, partial [Candidatus Aenigmatarchaeota archaeon]
MRSSITSASPESVLDSIYKNIFNNKEYMAFINAVKSKFKVSSVKFISAEEIGNELILSINELKSKVSALSGTESSMVVKTPSFVSYPGTGKTKGIEATLQELKNRGFIKDFIYHDMMKHDPISAPFGVTILKKDDESSGDLDYNTGDVYTSFERQSSFVGLLTNMFYSVIALNVIRANTKLEKGEGLYFSADNSKDFDLKGLDLKAGNNSLRNICVNIYTHLKSRMYPKNSTISESGVLNRSEFMLAYYYSKMIVFYSFLNAISIIVQDYHSQVKKMAIEYMIDENTVGLIRFVSMLFLVSLSRYMSVAGSDSNRGDFFIRSIILFTYLFIKDFYLNVGNEESLNNSLIRFYNTMTDQLGEDEFNKFVNVSKSEVSNAEMSGFIKQISVNYFNSLFDMVQTSLGEEDDYISSSLMEEIKSIKNTIQLLKGKSLIVDNFFLGEKSAFIDENIVNSNMNIKIRFTSRDEEFSKKGKNVNRKEKTYSLSDNEDVGILDYFNNISANTKNFISGYYYLFNILKNKVDVIMSVILSNDKDLKNIDYARTVELFNFISQEGKRGGLNLQSSNEVLHFVFPKEVEEFLRKAKLQYEKWVSSRNKKFIQDLKEGGIQRYEVSDADVYVLFLDEVFHMFSGDGAPIVATIWDGLANRADKFPPNVLLVLAGNSPTSAFFDSLANNSSKISNDSMKAFFDRLKLRFVIPDINFIYHRVGSYLNGILSKRASAITEGINRSSRDEIYNIHNKKLSLNYFDYYSNIFKLRLSDSKYCEFSENKYSEKVVRDVIQYATNFENKDKSLLNINIKDKESTQDVDFSILVYANVMHRFHEELYKYLSKSGSKSYPDFVKKYLEERFNFFWNNRDIIAIPKFAHVWLVSMLNAHYLMMNFVSSSLSNYQDAYSRGVISYEIPNITLGLGSRFSTYSSEVNSNRYERISSDLLYANIFYTLVAISYVSSLYNYGKCIDCVKNIANLYDAVI